MKTCAYCGRDNEDSVLHCAGCGTDEFKLANPPAGSPADPEQEWVTLVTRGNLAEADAVAGQLEAGGIGVFLPDQFLMQNANLGAMYGFVRVQVARGNLAAARDLLATPAPPSSPPTPPPPFLPA